MNVEDGSEVVGEHQVGGARVWGCERASRVGIGGGGLGGGPGRARRGVAASAVVVARGRRRSASGAALLWRNRVWRPRRVKRGSRFRRIGERGSVLRPNLQAPSGRFGLAYVSIMGGPDEASPRR